MTLNVWGEIYGPAPHSGGRVMDDGGIRLEEEGCRMTGETRWIIYHVLPPILILLL